MFVPFDHVRLGSIVPCDRVLEDVPHPSWVEDQFPGTVTTHGVLTIGKRCRLMFGRTSRDGNRRSTTTACM